MKLTIVIPVYNCAQYIEACIYSLLHQSFRDFEVVLVDDHGSDDSIDVAKRVVERNGEQDRFVFAQTQSNSGPGLARNVGVDMARGEYIAFVDSDDTIDADFCKELCTAANLNNADLAYCNAVKVCGDAESLLVNPSLPSGPFTDESKRFFLSRYVSMFWTFIYRRQMLVDNDIKFPSERSAEDSYFQTCALLVAKSIAFVDRPMYRYCVRNDSLSQKSNSLRFRDKISSFEKLIAFARQKELYEKFKPELDYIFVKKSYLVSILIYVRQTEKPSESVLSEIYGRLLNTVPDYAECSLYRKQYPLRMAMLALRYFPKLAMKMLSVYLKNTKKIIV